jgi:hypothetical protein
MNRASGRSSGFAQQGGCSGFPFPGALDADRKKKRESSGVTTITGRSRESGNPGAARLRPGPPVQARGQPLDPPFQARACTHLAGPVRNPSPPFRGEREGPTPHGSAQSAARGQAPAWEGEVGGHPPGIPHLTPALSAPRGGEGDAVSSAAPHCHEMCMRLRFRWWRR